MLLRNEDFEKKTIKAMIEIYCFAHHRQRSNLCADCQTVFEYAESRIEKCQHKRNNLVCSECKVHCFKQNVREKIHKIMRFSGPKMIWKHPLLAVRYVKNKIKSKKKRLLT